MGASALAGNPTPYLTLQFGGLLGILAGLIFLRSPGAEVFPWRALVGWYALTKVLELGDHGVWEMTSNLVSGHTLKHLAAGMAGFAIVRWMSAAAPRVSRASRRRPCTRYT